MKVLKEWFINAPWGKIALISWGDPNGEPVLLVHGRQDSAATFIPLLKYLPDNHHYVGVDLPGNGLSDPFPIGVMLTRFHSVVAVEMVVEHMKWRKFTYIAHSMGTEHGLFFNAIYPGKFKKCIYLDGSPAIQRLLIPDFSFLYESHYLQYYDNYESYNRNDRVYSKESATAAVMKARGMSEDQATVILSRNLRDVGNDQYRLSWDRREKILAPMFNSPEFYCRLFSRSVPPTLYISANQYDGGFPRGREPVQRIISEMEKKFPHFRVVRVKGGHDVHFKNPERVASYIVEFLLGDNGISKSKL